MRSPSPSFWIGAALVGLLVVAAAAAPWLTPYSPVRAAPAAILEAPSPAHWAGTDALGRDVLSRLAFGGRASLAVAFGIAGLSVGAGVVLGGAIGLAGGWVDGVAMRLIDIVLSVPSLVIALALAAALGPSLGNLVVVLGALGAPFYVRLFRGEALLIRERGHVQAARVMGAGFIRLLLAHVLPNLAPLAATFGSTALGGALVAASALSFVGLGAQPPTPEWGAMIYEGRNTIMYEWWCAVLPGLAVATAALGFILMGDALRDWLDPRGRR
ncbi:ABC transporter permease [Phenylobacterium sp.]|uniref:ABC transporter permease n=1 Tax=Phenylobacterium sp. TaxID=1871053 RepID=UPI0035B310A1